MTISILKHPNNIQYYRQFIPLYFLSLQLQYQTYSRVNFPSGTIFRIENYVYTLTLQHSKEKIDFIKNYSFL